MYEIVYFVCVCQTHVICVHITTTCVNLGYVFFFFVGERVRIEHVRLPAMMTMMCVRACVCVGVCLFGIGIRTTSTIYIYIYLFFKYAHILHTYTHMYISLIVYELYVSGMSSIYVHICSCVCVCVRFGCYVCSMLDVRF